MRVKKIRDYQGEVAEVRNRIAALKERLREVERAALDAVSVQGRVETWVHERAKKWNSRAEVFAFPQSLTDYRLISMASFESPGLGFEHGSDPRFDAVGCMICALFPDTVIDHLSGVALEAMHGAGLSLTPEDRAARIAKLSAEIDAEERKEEALIRESKAVGFEVRRRPDARPEIVLDLREA